MHLGSITATVRSGVLQDDQGPLPTPHTIWQASTWTWELSISLPLLVLLVWYAVGAWKRGHVATLNWRHAAFAGAWVSLSIALMSPVHRLGDVLFSAHMLQHEILLLVAAPLFAACHPAVTLLYALPISWRKRVGGLMSRLEHKPGIAVVSSAMGAFVFHTAALWLWHIPALYQATISSDLLHSAQHLTFLVFGVCFWSALYGAGRSTMSYGAGVLYVFGAGVSCGALGALLTFSSVLWYPLYADRTSLWNLSPIQDQQLGGLLMWVPSGVVFIAIGVWMFARWLAVSDRRLQHTTLAGTIAVAREKN